MHQKAETATTFQLAQRLLRYMPGVRRQYQDLQLVEAAWDSLALLSSLSRLTSQTSSGADLSRARRDFSALSNDMVHGLSQQALANVQTDLDNKAQVAIDVLVRNLFERTADIGFLALDEVLTTFAQTCCQLDAEDATHHPDRLDVQDRLAHYAHFYSVYRSVQVYDADLRLIAHHTAEGVDPTGELPAPADVPWLQQVAHSNSAYTERYGLMPSFRTDCASLVYAKALTVRGQPVGVLCLEFRLDDELPSIFNVLLPPQDDSAVVLALLDPALQVIGSSDPLQLPPGFLFSRVGERRSGVVRHLGREYLFSHRSAQPFEGYAGPGWQGLALIPLELAFETTDDESHTSELMEEVAAHPDFLSGELREIPVRSTAIRTALERSVWNGLIDVQHLEGQPTTNASDVLFAQTLLSEIGVTAQKTARAFASALQDLHRSVVRAKGGDSQHRATVAMQILDRNLYERANDCRWWALTPSLVRALQHPSSGSSAEAHQVLGKINDLYTVYTSLVLFDQHGTVVATSRGHLQGLVGTQLEGSWVLQCLQLQPHSYCVSPWASPALEPDGDHAPTFIYASALHVPGSTRAIGGIGLVWNGLPQMQAILRDCSLGLGPNDSLAFVEPSGTATATSGTTRKTDAVGRAIQATADKDSTDGICDIDGHLHVVGLAEGTGYREYRAHATSYQHQLQAVVLADLCQRQRLLHDSRQRRPVRPNRSATQTGWMKLATFWVGEYWLSVPASWVRFAAPVGTVLSAGQARPPVVGLAQLSAQIYPVIELAHVAGAAAQVSGAQNRRDQQMVVLSLPTEDGQPSMEMALRVDALGNIQEVATKDLKSLRQGNATTLVHQVVGVELEPEAGATGSADKPAPNHALLMLVSKDWLANIYQGLPVDMRVNF